MYCCSGGGGGGDDLQSPTVLSFSRRWLTKVRGEGVGKRKGKTSSATPPPPHCRSTSAAPVFSPKLFPNPPSPRPPPPNSPSPSVPINCVPLTLSRGSIPPLGAVLCAPASSFSLPSPRKARERARERKARQEKTDPGCFPGLCAETV